MNILRKASLATFMAAALCLSLGGCASVRETFVQTMPDFKDLPTDALAAVASELEAAVRAGNREPNLESKDGIILNTPEITQAMRSRAARIEILDQFLNTGFGYEESNGLVHIVRSKEYKQAYTGQERDRDALLVMGENENRWTIYESIIEANGYPGGSTSAIQKIFFDARVEHLPTGIKYEDASGNVVVK